MKRAVIPYDFNAFGQAIKAARMAKGESRKNVSDDMNISPPIPCEYREQRATAELADFL